MNYTQKISLDLGGCSGCQVIQAKQGDDGTRFLEITLTRNGLPFIPPTGTTARFRAAKPDGCSVDNPATISGNTVTVELTEQTLAVPGTVKADVVLRDAQGDILSTENLEIRVAPAPVGSGVTSSNEFLTLQALIRKAEGLEDSTALTAAEGVGF